MKNILRVIFLVALMALGVWGWLNLFPSPEAEIQHRLLKVAKLASFSASEGNIARVANVQRLGTYFTDDLEVKVDAPGLESHSFSRREELMQAAMAARSAVGGIRARFPDIRVKLGPGADSAVANAALEVTISTFKDPIFQELKISLKKIQGEWLINQIETVQTLKQ